VISPVAIRFAASGSSNNAKGSNVTGSYVNRGVFGGTLSIRPRSFTWIAKLSQSMFKDIFEIERTAFTTLIEKFTKISRISPGEKDSEMFSSIPISKSFSSKMVTVQSTGACEGRAVSI
jgi:hypothetical protein